jgi:hypothetical protein
VLLASAVSVLAGVLACSSSAPPVRTCATSDACPAGARCLSGVCVANAPPAADVALPGDPLQANVLLSFDASGTADPDPEDSVVAYAWTFRALSAGCAPPAAATTGAVATVRFGCAGRYAVDVTATDEMGASSTATEELDVAAYGGPALLSVGEDLPVGHVCTPTPRCNPASPVTLSATAPGFAHGEVSFAWTVEPPADRPLTSFRRVAFSPSAAVAAPAVTLETDGEAISGDWIFRVEARDAAGVIGTAAMRVSVLNRPPTVTATIPVPNHAFSGSSFTAGGEVPFTVSDPDGDALIDRTVEWRHAGDGTAAFAGTVLDDPPRVVFSIIVPYAAPEDALHLIGGVGLERTIVLGSSDVNGARTTESWPIVVGNRPPVLAQEPAPFTVAHRYDAAAAAYAADVPLSTWSDPDGDPLWPHEGSGTGDAACPDLSVVGTTARVACRQAFVGTPAVASFAVPHTVRHAVRDPWAPSSETSAVTFTIGNGPPALTTTAVHVAGGCTVTAECCRTVDGVCENYRSTAPGSTVVPSRWEDPDGDPFSVEVGAAGIYTPVQPPVCASEACPLEIAIDETSFCASTSTPVTSLPVTLSDGAASTEGSLPVQVACD